MNRPLEGLKVLDFSHVLAGPFATRVLGDMGADVVKVNSESRAQTTNNPDHPYYIMWNRNKRALALDLTNDEAKKICRGLCEQADVVIDNFSVGVLDRWGVGYDAVSQVNPGVIYIQMSGMGEGGPWSKFVTYAPTIHALSGLTSLTGVPGRQDIGLGFSYNDHMSGLHGVVGILAALEARARTGEGQRIEVSQFEVGANFAGPALMDLFANDVAATATGNRLPYDACAPHGVYRCAPLEIESVADERWIAIGCYTDAQWQALCGLMDHPEWTQAEAFASAEGRYAEAEKLDAHLAAWTATWNEYELMQACQAAGVPAGVVQNGKDLAEKDPHLAAAGFLNRIEDQHPLIGQTWADRLPLHFERTPCDQYERVRMLGEDNAAVLQDWLGLSEEQVRAHESQGVCK